MTTKTQKAPGIRKIERVRRVPRSNPPKTERVTEWEARVSLGLHPARRCTGRCRRWWWAGDGYPLSCCGESLGDEVNRKLQRTATRGTRPEAEAWRDQTRADHRRGVSPFKKVEPTKTTVAVFAETYLADRKPELDIRTWWRYRQLLDDACAVLGTIALDELRPKHVREMLVALRRKGQSASTAMQCKRVLNRMLVEAVLRDLIEINPASGVTVKVPDPVKGEVDYADALGLLDHADDLWRLPLALTIATGARRGEVLGVLRRGVRIEGDVARVTIDGVLRSNPETKTVERRAGSKSAKSTRTLTIEWEPAVALLRTAMNRPRKLDAEADLICADDAGHWPHPDGLSAAYRRARDRAGLDGRTTLKSLRDSVATFLDDDGASPADIAAQLGHSDNGELALKVYVQPGNARREAAGARLGRAERRVG